VLKILIWPLKFRKMRDFLPHILFFFQENFPMRGKISESVKIRAGAIAASAMMPLDVIVSSYCRS